MKRFSFCILVCTFVFLGISCKKGEDKPAIEKTDYSQIEIPDFNADSAYSYVAKQCSFGPRIPMSEAAEKCGDYLISFLAQYADTVYVQEFESRLWNQTSVKGRNIIASFNLASTDRVLMGAHWDSRSWADNDKDSSLHKTPIDGANDGASGVGVLMEIARIFKRKNTSQGLDIILFDLEDQGSPKWAETDIEDQTDWCLGSQFWSQNTHIPFYTAKYGILLDMVGYKNPRFTKEMQSMNYASSIMDKVWDVAASKGYSNIFVNEESYPIMDDHVWVNVYAKIPMIDIVQNDPSCSFFPHWHTTKDNMDIISRNTLKIVGDVCLVTIFSAQ